MTTELKKELENKGIKLVPLWQFIWIVIIAILSIGVSYGIATQRISQVEAKTQILENWKERHIDEVNLIRLDLEKRLISMEQKLDLLLKKSQ